MAEKRVRTARSRPSHCAASRTHLPIYTMAVCSRWKTRSNSLISCSKQNWPRLKRRTWWRFSGHCKGEGRTIDRGGRGERCNKLQRKVPDTFRQADSSMREELRHGRSNDGARSIGELCEPDNFGARVERPGTTSRSSQRPEDSDLHNGLACYVVTFSHQTPQRSAGVGYP